MMNNSYKTTMPDLVESFPNITENNTNLFAFIQGLAEGVINLYEFVHCRVPTGKSRLEWRYCLIFKKKLCTYLEIAFWKGFQRYWSIIFYGAFVIFLVN